MNILHRHPSVCQLLWLTAIFIVLDFPRAASATNLTEQYHLCKTDAEIETLRLKSDLIRVDAIPTHAALHPSWPETLVTLGLSIYTIITAGSKGGSWFANFFFRALVPFAIVVAWCISFIVAEINGPTAGWISCTMTSAFVVFLNLESYMEGDTEGDHDGEGFCAGFFAGLVPSSPFCRFYLVFSSSLRLSPLWASVAQRRD